MQTELLAAILESYTNINGKIKEIKELIEERINTQTNSNKFTKKKQNQNTGVEDSQQTNLPSAEISQQTNPQSVDEPDELVTIPDNTTLIDIIIDEINEMYK